MEKVTSIGKPEAKLLSEATRKALEAVAAEYGLSVKVGGGKYDPSVGTFAPKVEYSLDDAEQRAFAQQAEWFGLEPNDYGKTIEVRGKALTVIGVNPRASRLPIMLKGSDGRVYKMTEAAVCRALGRPISPTAGI